MYSDIIVTQATNVEQCYMYRISDSLFNFVI